MPERAEESGEGVRVVRSIGPAGEQQRRRHRPLDRPQAAPSSDGGCGCGSCPGGVCCQCIGAATSGGDCALTGAVLLVPLARERDQTREHRLVRGRKRRLQVRVADPERLKLGSAIRWASSTAARRTPTECFRHR